MKRLVAYSLLTLLAVGFPSAPASAQLLTSPSNEPEVTEPKKEEAPAVKDEPKKSEDSSDSKDAKKAKKTKAASDKAAKKAADAAAKKAAGAAKKAADSQAADIGNEASEAADVAAGKSTQPIGRRDKMRTPDADDIKVLEEKLEKKAAKKAKKDGDAKKTDGDATDAPKKADDTEDVKDKKASDDDEDKDGTESGAKTAKKDKVPFGKRMASFTTGAILGYPVAMAKRSVYQTKNGTRDFVGETKNPLLLIPAMVVSAPYGFVGGFFEGAQYSVMNSWKASGDEPFSKEAFSLED